MKNVKMISLLLIASMLVGLCACGGKTATDGDAYATDGDAYATDGDAYATDGDAFVDGDSPTDGDAGPNFADMANPLREVTPEEQLAVTGLRLDPVEGAENVFYFTLHDGENGFIAQTMFTYNGHSYVYRAMPSGTGMGDFSGIYTTWTDEIPVGVDHNPATVRFADDAAEIDWFDVVPGVSYCLFSVEPVGPEAITQLAGLIYIPTQSDVG